MERWEKIAFLVLGVTFVIALSITMFARWQNRQRDEEPILINVPEVAYHDKSSHLKPAAIKVHIKGAVKYPGVYEFPTGARVDDAVKKAQPLPSADINALNLAAFLKDGEEVFVPDKRSQSLDVFAEALNASDSTSASTQVAPRANAGMKIPINRATAKQLEALPGIGPKLASRIIEYRRKHGSFSSIDDLLKVRGVGPKKLEQIRPYIKLW